MIRSVLLLILTINLTGFVLGQSWEDSLRIGKQYYQNKQYEKAYQSFLEAQKLAPEHVDLSQDIGNAAYRVQDYEIAEKAFQATISNSNDEVQNAKNWHNVGNSQIKAKNYQAAIESYKESLRKNPNNEETRYNLAEAQRRLKLQEKQNQESQNQRDENKNQQDSQQQQDNSNPQDQNNEDQQNQEQDKSQGGESQSNDKNTEPESKLSNRKTDRILEDLLKQEMETKKKMQGVESGENQEQVKSGKKW